jgi:aryl-alcohol dehydrogenase-like predicted oxidoreductase
VALRQLGHQLSAGAVRRQIGLAQTRVVSNARREELRQDDPVRAVFGRSISESLASGEICIDVGDRGRELNGGCADGVDSNGRSVKGSFAEICESAGMSLNTRTLGGNVEVSEIGLGCMGMSAFYGTTDEKQSIATLHHAIDIGVTFFDTAEMYGPHLNEELLGKAFAGRRDEVKIATKFGIVVREDFSRGVDGSAENVRRSIEGSLSRLGTDHVDLYYAHRIDPDVPIEETVGALAELVNEGKILGIGLSEAAPETIRRAHAVHPITAIQTEYSLWSRDPEEEILPVVRELGIGFVPYSPLGRGFLAGRFNSKEEIEEGDFRTINPRFTGENFDRNLALLEKVRELAAEKDATPGQLALAWVLAQGDDIVPIPGTKRVKYLDENAAAAGIELTAEDLERIDAEVPAAAGERYDEAGMRTLGW